MLDRIKGMKKADAKRLLFFHAFFWAFSNLINPITPAMFLELGLPDYMFGVSFAAMAGASFFMAPVWGRLCGQIGCTKVIFIGFVTYAVTQIAFYYSVTQAEIIICRLAGGITCSAVPVATLAGLINLTGAEERSRGMLYYSVLSTAGCAVGYSIGGFLGSISIELAFQIQVVAIFLFALILLLTFKDPESAWEERSLPDQKKSGSNITVLLAVFMASVFCASFATTAYDNAYNYYVKEALKFPNYYNGLIRAGIGGITLIVDFTVGAWLMKKTEVKRSIIACLFINGVVAVTVPLVSDVPAFVVGNFIFYAVNALYLPLQQTMATEDSNKENSGSVAGMFNSCQYAGKVFGALFAGFIYGAGSLLPFYSSGIVFILGAGCSVLYYRMKKGELKSGQRGDKGRRQILL